MNALFPAKNSIYNVVAHILLKGVLRLDSRGSNSLCLRYYDRRMTVERAEELHQETLSTLKPILSSGCYRTVFVCMGKTYRRAIDGINAFFSNIRYSHGGIGMQLSQLRQFLYNEE